VLALGACTSRYGAYVTIEGSDALAFDRLELFFGAHLGDSPVPTSPHFEADVPAPASYLAKRLIADTDVQTFGARETSFTYYLPQTAASAKLGDVVVAVAFANGAPVGIGQLRRFAIPADDLVYTYTIELAAFDPKTAEVWGRRDGAACVRYQDPAFRDTVAVVRHDDLDCDAFSDAGVDCAPLRYCDGTSGKAGCTGTTSCLDDQPVCVLGACTNSDQVPRQCAPTTCLPSQLCSTCINDTSIDDVLECATDDPSHGDDERIPVIPSSGRLCTTPYAFTVTLPGGLLCEEPEVVSAYAFPPGTPNHFTVGIDKGASAETCTVTLAEDGTQPAFPEAFHVLLSFKGPTELRSTFVLGLQATAAACGPVVVSPASPVGVCP